VLYVIGLVTALLTAYYMTRQVIMVFFGEARWSSHADDHGAHGEFKPHESPPVMLLPLLVLAVLSIAGGIMQLPPFGIVPDAWRHKLEDFLHPVVEPGEAVIADSWAYEHMELLALIAIGCGLVGIVLGILVYARRLTKPVEPEVLAQGWYYDRGITAFMGGPGRFVFDAIAWFDKTIIDGAVMGAARVVWGSAGALRKGQTGNVRNYAGFVGVAAVLVLAWFVIVRAL
jgi:NADH-quinone oxidoreductase subunit L